MPASGKLAAFAGNESNWLIRSSWTHDSNNCLLLLLAHTSRLAIQHLLQPPPAPREQHLLLAAPEEGVPSVCCMA